jgi:hypothetical protein
VEDEAFRFLVSLAVPDTASSWERDADGRVSAVELWADDGSWARVEGGTVNLAGPRDLWRAVEDSAGVLEDRHHPGRERYGVTVEPDRQYVWLDSPGDECRTLPAEGPVRVEYAPDARAPDSFRAVST